MQADLETLVMERSKWRSLCKTSIQQFESDRIRALEAKREQRKTATIRSAACYPCQICGQTDVRRELDCTPTLVRINTDYDPGSVVPMAQSNNNGILLQHLFLCYSGCVKSIMRFLYSPCERLFATELNNKYFTRHIS